MNPPKTTTILLQERVQQYLQTPSEWPAEIRTHAEWRFPAEMQIIARRDKDLDSDVDSALARIGLCLFVMPPYARRTAREEPFVFVENGQLIVQINEVPISNETGWDAYITKDFVSLLLNNSNPGGLFAAPMFIDPDSPEELLVVEEAVRDRAKKLTRIFNVNFRCQYQVNLPVTGD